MPTELRAPVSSHTVPVESAQHTPKSEKRRGGWEELRGRVPIADAQRFKRFAQDVDIEIKDLMLEAWNDLLRKYGVFESGGAPALQSKRPKDSGAPASQQWSASAPVERESGAPALQEANIGENNGAPALHFGAPVERQRAVSYDHQLINDLNDDQLIDRSSSVVSGAPARQPDEEAAKQKEKAVLKYYEEQTGNKRTLSDAHAYRAGFLNRKGIFHPPVSGLPLHLIKLGIRQTVLYSQEREKQVLMFSYCLGRINQLAEEAAASERAAADERINNSPERQPLIPSIHSEMVAGIANVTEMPAAAEVTEQPEITLNPEDAEHWQRLLAVIRSRISVESFNTWFQPLTFEGFDQSKRLILLRATDERVRNWVNTNYATLVDESLDAVGLHGWLIGWAVERKVSHG